MNPSLGESLLEEVKSLALKAKDWTDEQKALAISVATDYGELMEDAAKGADVDEELDQLKAQVLNLAAGAEQTGVALFNQAIDIAIDKLRKLAGIVV